PRMRSLKSRRRRDGGTALNGRWGKSMKTARKGEGSRARGDGASGGLEILAAEKLDNFLEIEFVGLVKCIEPVAVDIEDKLRRTPRNERHDDFRARQAAAGDMAREFVDIGHDDGLLLARRRAADAL